MTQGEARTVDVWGPRTAYGPGERWPARRDQHLAEGVDPAEVTWHQSACVLCSNGCGLDIGVSQGRIVGVRGRADDRVNRGRLGPKGLYGWQANNAKDRLTRPLVRRAGKLVPVSWDEAMSGIVARTKDVQAKYGPGAIGFY